MSLTAEQIQFEAQRAKPVNSAWHDGLVPRTRAVIVGAVAPIRRALAVPSGKTINVAVGMPVMSTISAAGPGDVVMFAAGIHQSTTLSLKNGVTYQGVPGKSFLKFNTGGSFAMTLPSPANGVIIDGLMLENNGGLILANGGTTDCMITRCGLKYDGSGSSAVGFRSLNGNVRLTITKNYFHDSPSSYRDIDTFDDEDMVFSDNEMEGTCYGGHLDGQHLNLKVQRNVGVRWNRNMGIEIQDHNTTLHSGEVDFSDNCFSDFGPFITNWTFGASVPVQNTGKLTFKNNYICLGKFDASGNYSEAPMGGGNNPGIGVELGAGPDRTDATGNIVIGRWCAAIVTCQPGTRCSGNKVYGRKKNGNWGNVAFSGESGNHGSANFVPSDPSTANTIIETVDANTPRPPRQITRQPWNASPSPDPTMPAKIVTPAAGTILKPNQNVTAVATGSQTFDVDCVGDGLPSLPMVVAANGLSCVFKVPANATSTQKIRITAMGPGGNDMKEFAINASGGTPPPDPSLNYDVIVSTRNGKYTGSKQVAVP